MPSAEVSGDVIAVETRWTDKDLVKLIPGSRWDPDLKLWTLPLTWAACVQLRGVFRDNLTVGPELEAWSWREYRGRVETATTLRATTTRVDIPGLPARLYDFQTGGVAFMVAASAPALPEPGGALLADDMGLGKTPQTLLTLQHLGDDALPALVFCPNSVKTGWERQARLWQVDVNVYVVAGGAAQRRRIIEDARADPRALVVLNIESARLFSRLAPYGSVRLARCRECDRKHGDEKITASRCEVHPKELNEFGFRTVILDEAHRIKDPQSKQTRAVWAVAHDPSVRYRWALTGTPVAEHVGDLWSIMHFMAPREFPTKTKFIDRYCTPPDAPVWMADGTFKAIGDVIEGDTVIGFEKDPILGKGRHPKLRPTKVLGVHRNTSEILKVTLASGKTVMCTPNHRWLTGWYRPRQDSTRFMQFSEVAIGRKLRPVLAVPPPLDPSLEREAAWLGGVYDGEGSGLYISQSQVANPDVCAEIERILKKLNFEYRVDPAGFKLLGGRSAYAKFLHYCRPVKRHMTSAGQRYDHMQRMFYGSMGSPQHRWDEVVSIESLGEGPVISLTTETETYVVYGYASHNSLQSWNAYGGLDIVGINPEHRDEFYRILDSRFRRTPKALVLTQLPRVVRPTRWVDMVPKQARAYAELSTRLATRLETGEVLVSPNNLVNSTRLLQLASSYAEVEWVRNPLHVTHKCRCYAAGLDEHAEDCLLHWKIIVTLAEPSPKLDAMEEAFDELGGKPLVVAAMSRQLIDLAAARFKRRGVPHGLITGPVSEYERQNVLRRFRGNEINVVLMTVAAGGTGVDGLQHADTMFCLQRPWSMIENLQVDGRVDRIGSEKHSSVTIVDFVTRGTIEETDLYPRLVAKYERLEEINRDRARLTEAGIEPARLFELNRVESLIHDSNLAAPLTPAEHTSPDWADLTELARRYGIADEPNARKATP